MPKIKCPKCSNEFEVDLNYDRFYCEKCLILVKPGFRMNTCDLIFLNGKYESSTIKYDAQNTFEKTYRMFLQFADEYKADMGFVQQTLEQTRAELANEYARTNGDEIYIQQIIESRRAIAKVLGEIMK